MPRKKENMMILSLPAEMQERVKQVANQRGVPYSALVQDLLQTYLPESAETFDKVILKVPTNLRGDEIGLRKWLNERMEGIVRALCL